MRYPVVKFLAIPVSLVLCLVVATACAPTGAVPAAGRDILYQSSTLDALMVGFYDGDATYKEVREHGDFGLGPFDGLDGEMVELEGQIYQVKTDGVPYLVSDEMETPFAVVTFFEGDDSFDVDDPIDCADVQSAIDERLPTLNIPFAIKVDGTFTYVKARSVPKQAEPYPPLADVIAEQTIFEFSDVEGTLVGFRMPAYAAGANAAGYHLHFLTADRLGGGHVLECLIGNVRVEIDYTDEWHVELPSNEAFYQMDLESVAGE